MVLSLWEISSEFISGILLFPMDMPFSVIYFKIQVDHCVSTYVYMAMSPVFFSITMSQSPILPQLRLGWSSPKRSLCSSPRSAAPSSRNPGRKNIGRKRMDGLASKHTGCNINDKVNVDNDRSSSRDCLEELVQHQHQLLVGHRTLDKCWCWLMLTDADWCWLMMIDADWCWLILIDADWFWLKLIGADWCWYMLIDA